MSFIDGLTYRWRAAFHRADLDREIDDEMRHYTELEFRQRASESAARRHTGRPRRAVNVTYLREELRAMSRLRTVLDQAAQDLRYAWRTLRTSPTFAIVATLTLALGVGANATIFGIVDAVVLTPLPFPQPERMVRLFSTRDGRVVGSPSEWDVQEIARTAGSFEHLVPYDEWPKTVRVGGSAARPENMLVGLVSTDYFRTLGVTPLIGRLFTPVEEQPGRNYLAVISRAFWRQRFGGSPTVLGATMEINDEPYTIIGVVPDLDVAWLSPRGVAAQIWTPWALPAVAPAGAWRGATGNDAIARLRPGVSLDQARAEVARFAAQFRRTYPSDAPYGLTVTPLADTRAGPLDSVLGILGGAVALVLLIACTNLASLLHARHAARQREMLVRTALGASRSRLVRQLLIETVVLGGFGGALGFLIAIAGCAAVSRWHPAKFPQLAGLSVDGTVLGFSLAVSLAAAAIFGVWPAWSTSRIEIADQLRGGGRTGTVSRDERRARSALVVIQIALALILAASTALLTQSVRHLTHQKLGFDADQLFKAQLYIPPARYRNPAAVARFADELGNQIRTLPGVEAATVTMGYPPAAARWLQTVSIEGQASARVEDRPTAFFTVADDSYLRAYGTRLVRGRDFRSTDVAGGRAVAIVSESFVRRNMPNRDPLGARIELSTPIVAVASPTPITIVGVFQDVKNDGLNEPARPQIVGLYRQLPEFSSNFKILIVRTRGDPSALGAPIRRIVRTMDPDLALGEVATMRDVVAAAAGGTTYAALLVGAFAVLGLLLAAIGTYGVVSYMVAQRLGEIGIRTALGAGPSAIIRMVMGSGCALGAAGVLLGLLGSAAAARVLAGQVYGVSAMDPATLVASASGLLLVTALASAIPTWRALRIDAAAALHMD
ncbi:MAG TPA: ABC transporter permease [Gemmatimonadaceae bacterium]|nr:ABC transporter permease [Gemmatimonadaceae bacterium]